MEKATIHKNPHEFANIIPEHETLHAEEVIIGTEQGTTFLLKLEHLYVML